MKLQVAEIDLTTSHEMHHVLDKVRLNALIGTSRYNSYSPVLLYSSYFRVSGLTV